MKFKLFLISITCVINLSYAQQASKAKQLLDDVNELINSYNNMHITFKYNLDNKAENIHQTTKGTIIIMGELYNVNYLGGTRVYDGSKYYTILPEDEEINISTDEGEEESLIKLSKFFSFYKTGFNYAWGTNPNVKGRKIQNIVLTPKNSNSEIVSIVLAIDLKDKEIYSMIENGKNGTITTLSINKFRKNIPKITKEDFKVNLATYKKQGYTINEAQ